MCACSCSSRQHTSTTTRHTAGPSRSCSRASLHPAACAPHYLRSAIQHYTSALEVDSSVALFYAKRAAAYQSLKKLGQALRDLDSALEVDGNYSTGYLHRGKLHRWVGLAGGRV